MSLFPRKNPKSVASTITKLWNFPIMYAILIVSRMSLSLLIMMMMSRLFYFSILDSKRIFPESVSFPSSVTIRLKDD